MKKVESNIVTKNHLAYCFDVLINYLNGNKDLQFPENLKDEKYPLFVTWKIGQQKELRGCIGTFAHNKLSKTLSKYILISSQQDSRFLPIQKNILKDLHVALSFLHDFDDGKKWNEWQIGKHGIIIEFNYDGENYSGTFLPEVAKEQGWNHYQTLKHLMRKAGYEGECNDDLLQSLEIQTYQSAKGEMSYDEYLQFKKINKQFFIINLNL